MIPAPLAASMHRTLPLLALVVAVLIGGGGVRRADAQIKPPEGTVHTWSGAPLEAALLEIADLAGIAVVFAHRLVGGRTVAASYKVGDDPRAALEELLAGTGLRAERIRRGRYVIIAEPLNVAFDTNDPAAFTGTMRGNVVDAETTEPLWGAHVWLVDVDLGDVVGPDGSFSVPGVPTGEYVVRVSHVGYKAVRTRLSVYPVSPQLPPTIRLQPEIMLSTEATVRPGSAPEAPPGSTNLATRQAAALSVQLGEGDLAQTLVWLPGISRAGAGRGELVVRGADPGLTHYLRDGVPFIQPWHAFALFSAFQPEALQSVRFHKGSLPAELGDGLAGVVELQTRDGLVERPVGMAALSPVAGRIVLEAPLSNRAGLFIAARRSTLGWLFPPSLDRQSAAVVLDPLGTDGRDADEAAGHFFYDGEAKLTWNPRDRHRLEVGGYLGGDHLSTPVLFAGPGLDADHRWTNGLGSLKYSILGRRAFVSTLVYHSRFDATEALSARDASTTVRSDVDSAFRETGLQVDADYFLSVAHQLRFGTRLRQQRLGATISESFANGDETPIGRMETSATKTVDAEVYMQDTWRPSTPWLIQLGVRAGLYTDGRRIMIGPRVHARWTAKPERLFVRGGISRQVQTLHRISDRYAYTYDLASNRLLLSGEMVAPASAWQIGVGSEWAPLRPIAFSVDVYARLLENVLEPIDPAGIGEALAGPGVDAANILRFYRPSEGRAYGVELAARADLEPWVLGLSYAVGRTEIQLPGDEGWRPSRYDRPHTVGVLVQRSGAAWSMVARLSVQSGLPTAEELDGTLRETRFPLELSLDLSAGYRFRWFGFQWEAQAQALNLSGQPSMETPSFADGTAALLATDVRSRSLLPLLSLKASW